MTKQHQRDPKNNESRKQYQGDMRKENKNIRDQ